MLTGSFPRSNQVLGFCCTLMAFFFIVMGGALLMPMRVHAPVLQRKQCWLIVTDLHEAELASSRTADSSSNHSSSRNSRSSQEQQFENQKQEPMSTSSCSHSVTSRSSTSSSDSESDSGSDDDVLAKAMRALLPANQITIFTSSMNGCPFIGRRTTNLSLEFLLRTFPANKESRPSEHQCDQPEAFTKAALDWLATRLFASLRRA